MTDDELLAALFEGMTSEEVTAWKINAYAILDERGITITG